MFEVYLAVARYQDVIDLSSATLQATGQPEAAAAEALTMLEASSS